MRLSPGLGNLVGTLLLASSALASPLVPTSEVLDDRATISKRSFTNSCNSCVGLNSHVIRCNCGRSDGVYQQTTLDLDLCIANNQGYLVWRRNGGYSASCTSYQYSTGAGGTMILWNQCVSGSGQWVGNGLTLNEQVHNYNGVLGCNSVPW